ncbi:MAG: hypothetical protein H6R04_1023 [Burkholderiaceae bacterium]|nr:hypothetical protein [Burkholderiaceae bacterium]
MRFKKVVPLLAAIILLAGCGKNKITCSDETAQSVIHSLLTEETEKVTASHKKDDGTPVFDTAKIRATLQQIKITVGNIRTSKQDPNSTKVFCEGTLKLTVPTDLLNEADKGRELLRHEKISDYAKRVGFEKTADIFSKGIIYNAQPTDDGKKVFVEIENAKLPVSMLDEIVSSAMARPLVEERKVQQEQMEAKRQAEQVAENERIKAESAKQQQEQRQANLGQAKANNELINQQINEIWGSLPDFTRKTLLAQQRAWIKKKEVDCKVEAAGKTTDPTDKETHRLNCDSLVTKQRAQYLQQYLQR